MFPTYIWDQQAAGCHSKGLFREIIKTSHPASDANYPGQVEALVNEVRKPEPPDETHIMVNLGHSAQLGDHMMGLNQVYYTGPDAVSADGSEDEATGKIRVPPMLKGFRGVRPQLEQLNSLRIMTLVQGATEHAIIATERRRCAYMDCTLRADRDALVAAAAIYSRAIEPLKPLDGTTLCLTLQAYPRSLLHRTAELGGNVHGLDASEPLVTILLLKYWRRREDDGQSLGVLRGALDATERDADARGQRVPYTNLNYASDFQDPFSSYEENKKSAARSRPQV